MPIYFAEQPLITEVSCQLLERSVTNLTKSTRTGETHWIRLNFLYDFYSNLRELGTQTPSEEVSLEDALDCDLEEKSMFLATLLKACIKIPQEVVVLLPSPRNSTTRTNKKLRRKNLMSSLLLKHFGQPHQNITWDHYCQVGFALFKSLEAMDRDFSIEVYSAWRDSYSLLLRLLVFEVADVPQIQSTKHTRSQSSTTPSLSSSSSKYFSSTFPMSTYDSTNSPSVKSRPRSRTCSSISLTLPSFSKMSHRLSIKPNKRHSRSRTCDIDSSSKRRCSVSPKRPPPLHPKQRSLSGSRSRKDSLKNSPSLVRRLSETAVTRTRKLSHSFTRRLSTGESKK
eukprot:TRINITY_DN512_c0_g1_i4.p1 TRINITY_DN512_c0_g1~~TRINITY_DN512_c0_g1_i4.p1  ORF type:complete len:339 (-),score=53.32 TRINITY_DN512_c0_g1_i4:627-1643(-)